MFQQMMHIQNINTDVKKMIDWLHCCFLYLDFEFKYTVMPIYKYAGIYLDLFG